MPRDFRQALRQADQKHAEAGLPSAVDRRLQERLGLIEAPKPAIRWTWLAAGAVVAAAVLLFVAFPRARAPKTLDVFAVSDASHDLGVVVHPDRVVEVTQGKVTLLDEAEGIAVTSIHKAAVRKEPGGIRVVSGMLVANVAKRAKAAVPARVFVSDGVIEILGTRFYVDQRGNGGTVSLEEGSIRFIAKDGRKVTMVPGSTLSWPLLPVAPAEPPQPQPVAPASTPEPVEPPVVKPAARVPVQPAARPAAEPERIEDLLARIDELRSRGRFEAAAQDLERALAAGYPDATRERLSFELGTILGRPGSDAERACRHWQDHSRKFPKSRYDREIEQAVRRLACPGP